jgi:GMP synthase (glutamine-hydrolysing)
MRVLIVNINLDPTELAGCSAIASAIEQDAAELEPNTTSEVRVRPWRTLLDATGALVPELSRWAPHAVVLGPNGTPFPAYPPAFDRFLSWVRARRGPTLGICGGHQALALAHGAPVGPVHPVPAATTSYAGMPRVDGKTRVRLMGDYDPLLEGLPDEIDVVSSHVDEVKDIPPGFRLLALGEPSKVQILRADRRPLWGVQFHPERGDGPDRRVIRNFLAFATRRAE